MKPMLTAEQMERIAAKSMKNISCEIPMCRGNHDWRIVVIGWDNRTYVCHNCRKIKREINYCDYRKIN